MSGAGETALDTRARLGLSFNAPVPDLLGFIENVARVPVIVQQLGEGGIAGAYTVRRGVPFILINGSMPVVRSRFTLAHEFGHHVLGHGLAVDKTISLSRRQPAKEVAANCFAAEFLLPLGALDSWLRRRGYPTPELPLVVEMAQDFRVSALVAVYRLRAAGRLDSKASNVIESAIEAGEHRRIRMPIRRVLPESLGDVRNRSRRLPGEAEYLLLRALGEGLLSETDVEAKLQLTLPEVKAMLAQLVAGQPDEI